MHYLKNNNLHKQKEIYFSVYLFLLELIDEKNTKLKADESKQKTDDFLLKRFQF